METPPSAGIIAAGLGSRFREQGVLTPKPMIQVAGYPLIGHALRSFESSGIRRAVIIFNESERDCVLWVEKNFPRLETEIIVKSTQSSFESFWLVGEKLGPGRHLVAAVDSISHPGEVRKMAALGAGDAESVYLGLTEFVEDEKPLWAEWDQATRRITALGVSPSRFAAAGYYNVPHGLFRKKPGEKYSSLRKFLGELPGKGISMYGVPLSQVVDVDSPRDIPAAEELLRSLNNV